MTGRGKFARTIYVRITEDGKRKWVSIGYITPHGEVVLKKGIPNAGWYEGTFWGQVFE